MPTCLLLTVWFVLCILSSVHLSSKPNRSHYPSRRRRSFELHLRGLEDTGAKGMEHERRPLLRHCHLRPHHHR
uniref:Secreted protein n=1 Tax=Brassica oleracea TaxID=3712 RepID=A0A3P6DC88_BRAOL|nr:unnamed protein product [Brassica oleracea]